MSLTSLISDNLKFAISQINVSLTSLPSNGETYSANKQDAESSFDIYEDGREEMIDTKFYIARDELQGRQRSRRFGRSHSQARLRF